ncbi:nuclear transport factor 2 family protein [Actinocorallia aurantiaca]|uniref:SnoaL-like domain-containing protein n=1 Tax=Actinocorallia aurantiaca TaxID=46204 RepID=A0ABN3UAY5_9ACTN
MTTPSWREGFLTAYTEARRSGDVTALSGLLADDLRLQDPQLPGGTGSKADLLKLIGDLAAACTRLDITPHGPVCASSDGSVFTQRWFIEAEPAGDAPDGPGRVHAETFESFTCADGLITTVAIFVRDLTVGGLRPA